MSDLNVELVAVDDLQPDPNNARTHGEDNLTAIRGSLELFGQVKPIVATADGVVLAGNATLQVAKEMGWKKVAVVRTPADWSLDRSIAYALADNRTGELAEWNADVLADQLLELDSVGWDLAQLGFPTLMPPVDPEPVPGSLLGPEKLPNVVRCPSCGSEFAKEKK